MIDGDGNAAPSTEGGTAAVDTAICGESTDATLDIPVPALPPLPITTTDRMYIGVDFIDGLKVAFKAVFADYCIAPVAPLPKLEFSNVQALSIASKPKSTNTSRRLSSTQQNVRKLSSAFQHGGFFTNESIAQKKVTDAEFSLVVDAEDVLYPVTADMLRLHQHLISSLENLKAQVSTMSKASALSDDIFERIDELGNTIQFVSDMLEKASAVIKELKHTNEQFISVRKVIKSVLAASQKHDTSQLVNWSKLAMKADRILALVDEEERKMNEQKKIESELLKEKKKLEEQQRKRAKTNASHATLT